MDTFPLWHSPPSKTPSNTWRNADTRELAATGLDSSGWTDTPCFKNPEWERIEGKEDTSRTNQYLVVYVNGQ